VGDRDEEWNPEMFLRMRRGKAAAAGNEGGAVQRWLLLWFDVKL